MFSTSLQRRWLLISIFVIFVVWVSNKQVQHRPSNQINLLDTNTPTTENGKILTVLTLNVCFKATMLRQRMEALAELILQPENKPQIIALQEVTLKVASYLNVLMEEEYQIAYSKTVQDSYGMALMIRRKGRKSNQKFNVKEYQLDSFMGQSLFVVEIWEGNSCDFAVGSIHLESLDNHKMREAQMKQCAKIMSKYPDNLVVGDFNFDSSKNHWASSTEYLENDSLLRYMPNHVDVWTEFHSKEVGDTFDTTQNWWAKGELPKQQERARYDRSMASLRRWKLLSISICADKPLNLPVVAEKHSYFISDHFGLLTKVLK
jgi:endonuclease/exonuclease/phosphatase family metal-dependent hydrolase